MTPTEREQIALCIRTLRSDTKRVCALASADWLERLAADHDRAEYERAEMVADLGRVTAERDALVMAAVAEEERGPKCDRCSAPMAHEAFIIGGSVVCWACNASFKRFEWDDKTEVSA